MITTFHGVDISDYVEHKTWLYQYSRNYIIRREKILRKLNLLERMIELVIEKHEDIADIKDHDLRRVRAIRACILDNTTYLNISVYLSYYGILDLNNMHDVYSRALP